jgi:hypothetical protein
MDALQKAKLDETAIYPIIKEADECFERAAIQRHRHPHKPTTLYHLSKYLKGRNN